MPYHLMSDARARAVAKDLSQLAKELGFKLPLTAAQRTTARLMEYDDWNHLLANVGASPSPGPEDHELSDAELDARAKHQRDVLLLSGFPEDSLAEVLGRIRPTGRADTKSLTRNYIDYPDQDRYHPNRILSAWDGFMFEFEERGIKGKNYYYEGLDRLQQWAKGRRMNVLDARLIDNEEESMEAALATMIGAFDRGWLVDAEGVANLPSGEFLEAAFSAFPKDFGGNALYVHLGIDAFPSPYDDAGVEGVYVEVDSMEGIVTATVVCSEPPYPQLGEWAGDERNTPLKLRDRLRHGWMGFYQEEDDLNAQIDAALNRNGDELYQAWAPFIGSPVRAAINALALFFTKALPITDSVPGLDERLKKKLARASTDKQFYAAFGPLEGDLLSVRFIGSAQDALRHRTLQPRRHWHTPTAQSIDLLIDDTFDLLEWDACRMARIIQQSAIDRRKGDDEDERVWARATASLLQAELHVDNRYEAARTASDMLRDGSEAVKPYLPLVWLTSELIGGSSYAKSVEEKLDQQTWRPIIERLRETRKLIGEPDSAGKILENGVHIPFMIQSLEKRYFGGPGGEEYSKEWHYGHSSMHDAQTSASKSMEDGQTLH